LAVSQASGKLISGFLYMSSSISLDTPYYEILKKVQSFLLTRHRSEQMSSLLHAPPLNKNNAKIMHRPIIRLNA